MLLSSAFENKKVDSDYLIWCVYNLTQDIGKIIHTYNHMEYPHPRDVMRRRQNAFETTQNVHQSEQITYHMFQYLYTMSPVKEGSPNFGYSIIYLTGFLSSRDMGMFHPRSLVYGS